MEIGKDKMPRLYLLSGLKFVAMLIIVAYHYGFNPIDLGARMVEFLFVASGFLIGYNYYRKEIGGGYLYKKIRKIWPLHVLTLLCFMLLNFKDCILGFQNSDIPILLSNLFLLQAWSPRVSEVAFSYNGISWFLCALIFCYFMSPYLLKTLKGKRLSLLLFCLVAFVRFALEYWSIGQNLFSMQIHTSPVIRCLEFYMGMLLVPCFLGFKEKLDKYKTETWFTVLWTFLEMILMCLVLVLMFKFNDTWLRGYYVLMFCVFTFFVSMDYGYCSKICSIKFIQNIIALQFEIYMLQYIARLLFGFADIPYKITVLIWFLLLFCLAFLYKRFLEDRLAKLLDKTLAFFRKILYKDINDA